MLESQISLESITCFICEELILRKVLNEFKSRRQLWKNIGALWEAAHLILKITVLVRIYENIYCCWWTEIPVDRCIEEMKDFFICENE